MRRFPIEKARLQVALPPLYLGLMALLCYGWILEKSAPLAVTIIFIFLMGVLLNSSFNTMSTMLVDLFPERPATATAANNLVRCFMGAAGTAVILLMIQGMGRGWCFTFLAALVFVTSPMLWALLEWGPAWREQRSAKIEAKAKEKSVADRSVEEEKVIEARIEEGKSDETVGGHKREEKELEREETKV